MRAPILQPMQSPSNHGGMQSTTSVGPEMRSHGCQFCDREKGIFQAETNRPASGMLTARSLAMSEIRSTTASSVVATQKVG
jgi:hypothetical protein